MLSYFHSAPSAYGTLIHAHCTGLPTVATFRFPGLSLLPPSLFSLCLIPCFLVNEFRDKHFPLATTLATFHKYWRVVHLLPFRSN